MSGPATQGESIQAGNLVSRQKRIPGAAGPTPPHLKPGAATFRGGRTHILRETLSSRETSCRGERRFLYQRFVQTVVIILSCSLSHSWEFNAKCVVSTWTRAFAQESSPESLCIREFWMWSRICGDGLGPDISFAYLRFLQAMMSSRIWRAFAASGKSVKDFFLLQTPSILAIPGWEGRELY